MKKQLALGGFPVPRLAAGDVPLYSTGELFTVLRAPENAPELRAFWLQFFPETHNSDRQKIYFDDIDDNEYRLAPFVAPNVQGRVIASKGFETKSFAPAYVKVKHVVDPSRSITRQAGEALLGSLSRAERYDAVIGDNIRRERLMIENRWEYMACKAITDGAITIKGDDYPTVTMDFQRDASLTNTLSGGALWSAGTATPIADLQRMRSIAFRLSRAPITNVIFGLQALAAFLLPSHGDVQELLNAFRRGNTSEFDAANINDGSPYQYIGQLSGVAGAGALRMWSYSNFYESMGDGTDDAGDPGDGMDYFDPKCVIGVGGAIRGVKAFGAIADRRAGLASVPIFPKMWDEEDPSVTYTMCQSAPIMVPLRPNNSFKLKVVA